MARTVRLSEKLTKEVKQYGEREGLTVNALIVVALREYLDRRQGGKGSEGPMAGLSGAGGGVPAGVGGKFGGEPPMGLAMAIAKRVQGVPVRVKTKKRRGR